MAARLTVELTALERRLAKEEVDSLGQPGASLARARVSGVRECPAGVRYAEAKGLNGVVREARRDELEPRSLELLALRVLLGLEDADEHVWRPEARAEGRQLLTPAGREPELRL